MADALFTAEVEYSQVDKGMAAIERGAERAAAGFERSMERARQANARFSDHLVETRSALDRVAEMAGRAPRTSLDFDPPPSVQKFEEAVTRSFSRIATQSHSSARVLGAAYENAGSSARQAEADTGGFAAGLIKVSLVGWAAKKTIDFLKDSFQEYAKTSRFGREELEAFTSEWTKFKTSIGSDVAASGVPRALGSVAGGARRVSEGVVNFVSDYATMVMVREDVWGKTAGQRKMFDDIDAQDRRRTANIELSRKAEETRISALQQSSDAAVKRRGAELEAERQYQKEIERINATADADEQAKQLARDAAEIKRRSDRYKAYEDEKKANEQAHADEKRRQEEFIREGEKWDRLQDEKRRNEKAAADKRRDAEDAVSRAVEKTIVGKARLNEFDKNAAELAERVLEMEREREELRRRGVDEATLDQLLELQSAEIEALSRDKAQAGVKQLSALRLGPGEFRFFDQIFNGSAASNTSGEVERRHQQQISKMNEILERLKDPIEVKFDPNTEMNAIYR